MKDDIRMWLSFLEKINGSCTFGLYEWLSNMQLDLYTDSAGSPDLGCGVYFSRIGHVFSGLLVGIGLK